MRNYWRWIVFGMLFLSLQGCVAVVAGGAVVGVAAADRRSLGAQADDKVLAVKAIARLSPIAGPRGHLNVASYNRKLLITGEVPDRATKNAITREARGIGDTRAIINQLLVALPSSLSSRSQDAYITSKVKASLFHARGLPGGAIKVITEAQTVFLMGIVTEREARQATQIAAGVDGVHKVVKVFTLISEEDLMRGNIP